MKYLFLTLFLVGCASGPVTYKTGDCMKAYNTLKFGEPAGVIDGVQFYELYLVDSGQEKVRCPDEKTNDRQRVGRDRD